MTEVKQIMPLTCKNCGAVPSVFLKWFNIRNMWFVQCPECGATGSHCIDRDEAVSAWNSWNEWAKTRTNTQT